MHAMNFGRALVLGMVFALAVPYSLAHAQMNFEGLDLGGSKKKKKKKKKNTPVEQPETAPEPKKTEEKKTETSSTPAVPDGLDLSKTAEDKGGDKKKSESAATMTFDTVDISGKTGDRQRLDSALALFKEEKYDEAALAASELMQDPKMAALHVEADYLLAKSLYRMGMYHSALGEFSKILAKGPNTKFFKSSLEWLFFISHKTTNETVILDEIAKYSNFEFPEKFRSEFHYLLARYHFVRGKALDEVEQKGEADKSFDQVKRLVMLIPKNDAFFPRAKYLEGLAYFRDNKPESALEAMKEVVRVTRLPPGPMTNERKLTMNLRELAFMQLARTHYGAKQNRYAMYYYGKIERGGPQWLEALFESSWAAYRIGQYEQALGNLITLSSPFFRDEYFPEALILKAVIYYENCRYKEALTILEDFERIYSPVQKELATLVSKNMDSSEYYNVLAEVQKKNRGNLEKNATDLILERVLKLALTDQDLKKTNESILELEGEIDAIGNKSDSFKYSELSKNLIEGLKQEREQNIKKAGIMAKGKLEFELDQLKQLLGNGLRIRFETTTKEKDFLEASLVSGGDNKDKVRKYKYSVAVSDDHLYWPFEGEFWRDELGTYQYTLTKGCRDQKGGNDSQ